MSNFLTEQQIESMADEIKSYMKRWGFEDDVVMFYNGKRAVLNDGIWTYDNKKPENSSDYVAKNHILTMVYDGAFYDLIYDEFIDKDILLENAEARAYLKRIYHSEIAELIKPFKEEKDFTEESYPSEFESYEDYLVYKYEAEAELEDEFYDEFVEDELWTIRDRAVTEFHEIFDRYGVWFNFGESWSITCHYENQPEEYLKKVSCEWDCVTGKWRKI